MKYLDRTNIENLLLGTLFFGTGGGLPYGVQKSIVAEVLKKIKRITLQPTKKFASNAFLASVYGVGNPARTNIDFASLTREAVSEFKELTQIEIAGVIPGELGAESLAIQAASILDIPVVDTDLVGGRAAPEMRLDLFTVRGLPITPLLAKNASDKTLLFTGSFLAQEIDVVLRKFFEREGSGIVIGYPIRAKKLGTMANTGTLSRAIEIGKYLKEKRLKKILKVTGGVIVGKTRIKKVALENRDGFLQGTVNLPPYSVDMKNENMILRKKKAVVAKAPELIILLDENLLPIHNSKIQGISGTVTIVTIPAQGYWKKDKNKKLWSI